MKLIKDGKINTYLLSIYLIMFISFFYHLNSFLYNPRIVMYIFLIMGIVLLYRCVGGISKRFSNIDIVAVLTLVPYLFRNREISSGSYDAAIMQISVIVVFLLLARRDTWMEIFQRFELHACMVMVLFTVAFWFFPALKELVLSKVFPGNTAILNTTAAIGLTHHYSANGNFMAIALGAFFWLRNPQKSKSYWVGITVAFICLLLTQKRGPLLWCACGLLVSFYFFNSDKKSSRLFKLLALIVGLTIIINILRVFIPQINIVFERFAISDNSNSDVTLLSGRENLYLIAWNLFRQNPVFGIGWGGFNYSAAKYLGVDMGGAHNIYLQLLAETGIVGTTIYILYFVVALYQGIHILKMARKGYFCLDERQERILAFAVFVMVYYITYGFSGLVLTDVMLVYLYTFSVAVVRNIGNNLTI